MTDQTKNDAVVLRALHPRILLAFDFDETLAPNTTDALLSHLGQDPDEFRATRVQPRVDDGWEQRLAEAAALVSLSHDLDHPITDATFAAVAAELELYPGVVEMFARLRDAAGRANDVEVEFHLITAGFVHIPSHTSIAEEFTSILGGAWAFDDTDGGIVTPKGTLGHYEKVRHLLALAKGLDGISSDTDRDVDVEVPEQDWHVPFEQMIFVGDGDSDLPAFDLMKSRGGTAIAVHQRGALDWESRGDMRDGRQVASLAESDFDPEGPLMLALCLAVERAALWIEMLRTAPRDHGD